MLVLRLLRLKILVKVFLVFVFFEVSNVFVVLLCRFILVFFLRLVMVSVNFFLEGMVEIFIKGI